jgi:hypothetical protein
VKPENHESSLAIWDVPARAVTGCAFKIKVGAKCAAGCQLAGGEIAVSDETGARVASQKLGETPWHTTGLFWTEVDLPAPANEGVSSWSATFESAPHEKASASFSFVTVRPPEHTVTIQVIDRDTGAPVQDVAVRLGLYRASTVESGLAEIAMAKGVYELTVRKVDYEASPRTVEVAGDANIQVEIGFVPRPMQDPYWG